MRRKIAAILVGDIVGSTQHMEVDEDNSVKRFDECLKVVSKVISSHDGRVFNRQGDALLAEFRSPVNAIRAAMNARGVIATIAGMAPNDIRFGLHLADVVEIDGDLRGDGVNIAARIQASADPGAIDVSDALFHQVRRNSPCVFDELGPRSFKGISEPIRIYRVSEQLERHRLQVSRSIGKNVPTEKRPYSISVLPFVASSSADDDQQFLAEGFTEDLILELGRYRRLFVLSRSASMALTERDPVKIGDELGVRFVLSGSVRRLGSKIRLNLSLSETDSGTVLWADRIQKPFDEIVELMDEVTARVAATVSGRMEDADLKAARMRPPDNLSAYECFLRGLDYHRRGGVTEANLREAASWFERAIAEDPNFARAHAMFVCAAYGLEGFPDEDMRARVRHALLLDPNDPEANRVMGSMLLYEHEYDASRQFHLKALELAPNDAYIIGRCAAFHLFAGQPEEALNLLDRAESLDPYLPVWCTEERVAANYVLHQFEDALQAARRLAFQTRRTSLYRVACRVALGDIERARRLMLEAIGTNPDLNPEFVLKNEHYKDSSITNELLARLHQAGLPKVEKLAS